VVDASRDQRIGPARRVLGRQCTRNDSGSPLVIAIVRAAILDRTRGVGKLAAESLHNPIRATMPT